MHWLINTYQFNQGKPLMERVTPFSRARRYSYIGGFVIRVIVDSVAGTQKFRRISWHSKIWVGMQEHTVNETTHEDGEDPKR